MLLIVKRIAFFVDRHLNKLLVFVCVACVITGLSTAVFYRHDKHIDVNVSDEILAIADLPGDFSLYAEYFKKLSEDKGALFAFEVLGKAYLTPGTDLHVLAHVVGDELYKQYGIQGIKYCTKSFGSACSHSIVGGALFEHGPSSLSEIAKGCKEVSGGLEAYGMCYHGVGHGVLAYVEYDLPKAVALCGRVGMGTTEQYGQEGVECVGGVIMELISGGGHDKKTWARVSPQYLKDDDPLYPCDSPIIPEESKGMCYMYLTPHLFKATGGDAKSPTPAVFKTAFQYCAKIPIAETKKRMACYGGFGKEFPAIRADHDLRVVAEMSDAKLKEIFSWCALSQDASGTQSCSDTVLSALYWGGENVVTAPVRYCSLVADKGMQSHCFETLEGMVFPHMQDAVAQRSFCATLGTQFTEGCVSRIPKDVTAR